MVANLSFAAVLFHALYLFWIRSAVAQSPVDRDQLSMRNCHDRSLTSPPELHSLESPLEKRFLVRRSSPSRLRQGRSQPAVALSRPSAFSFAGALIVAGTNRRPGCQMMTVGKRSFWTHVHSVSAKMLAAEVGLIPGTVHANRMCCSYGFNRTAISLSNSSIISSMSRMCRRD